mgnify:CR=1 FL=1
MAKKWGQHFLIRQGVVERMLKQSQISEGDQVVEIGPGKGFLTHALLKRGVQVTAVEIDPELCQELRVNYGKLEQFQLLEGDVMQIDPLKLCPQGHGSAKLVANLPYQIASALILRLLPFRKCWKSLTLMVQKEVADRICATPEQRKEYGSLSLAAGLGFDCRRFLNVPPAAFRPKPKVDSSLIFLEPRDSGIKEEEEEEFLNWSRTLFENRRKLLSGSIRRHFPDWYQKDQDYLQETIGKRRPEAIPHQEWLDLFRRFINFRNRKC